MFKATLCTLLCTLSALAMPAQAAPSSPSGAAAGACPALFDRTVPRLQDEKPQSLCQYAGRVVLVVNTASQCGFTSQYRGLEALYEKYREAGLVVLGFPSNDFAGQEPGSNAEIAAFCEDQFSVRFPMFMKTPVTGAKAHPFYADLARLSGSTPKWNFHKYLIGRDGRTVKAYTSLTTPEDGALLRDLRAELDRR
ncbi:glutathione peroxidase [Sphaerotilus uruguayifluvii]|uniref:Glutathione peroxidase n=1 Tax=Sphaerotilus uruguayifluvii TaxID=2735897 RepID=A0ABX2FXA5_9BURK|nr:glutathione peroxidase [Leptothrix sp. C29]NRT54643.1 glutathione peroxidase [Leptothrix sp. C29]